MIGFTIDNDMPIKKAAIPVVVFHLVSVALSMAMTVGLQGFYANLLGGTGAPTVEP